MWANEGGGMGAGKCERGQASANGANEGGRATVGFPSPLFTYLFSFSLSEMATVS